MGFVGDLTRYARFARGLQGVLRHPVSLAQAREIVKRRMAEREGNFLELARRIFNHPGSPYLPLMRHAGCEIGDIEDLVRSRGVEPTLRVLYDAGVYVTFEEFKCRTPIVRGSLTLHVQPGDFDNPHLTDYYEAETSGSTGAGTVIRNDLAHLADRSPHVLLAYDAYGVRGAPTAIWRGTLPAPGGIANILRGALIGQVPRKWFSPVKPGEVRPSFKHHLKTLYVVHLCRLSGLPVPWPEPVSLNDAVVLARWAREMLATDGRCVIRCHVSMAARVCIAARERGLNLAGATFIGGGEPATPAKVREITRAGARWIPSYTFNEIGQVGAGCARPVDGEDVHVLKDAVALVQYPRRVPGWDVTVDAFYFTSLLPSAPKIMLNVESDDYGILEERACGCPFEAYGFTEHLREIRSFSKVTSEGMTLVGSEMIRILEEVLPGRFGGSPLDYQLAEEEDEHGFTRLNLFISPRVPIPDEAAVIDAVIEEIRPQSQARTIWKQAQTIRVRRQEPVWSGRGKLMPLNLVRAAHRKAGTPPE